MSMLPDTIETSRLELREKIHNLWDVDSQEVIKPAGTQDIFSYIFSWDEQVVTSYDRTSSPLLRLVSAFGAATEPLTRQRLSWLVFFAARRVLPCWELYCDTTEPRDGIGALEQWLTASIAPDSWEALSHAPFPSYRGEDIVDCRNCDTDPAGKAVANAVQYVMTSDPSYAVEAIEMADLAFDQSPLGEADSFREWFIETAIPVAWENREMTVEEQARYRTYDPDKIRVS